MAAEVQLLVVGVSQTVGEVHDASGVGTMFQPERMSEFVGYLLGCSIHEQGPIWRQTVVLLSQPA